MYKAFFLSFILSVFFVGGIISEVAAQETDKGMAYEYKVIPTIEQAVVYTFVGLANPTATDDVLARLNRLDVKATFFIFEREMSRYPAEVRKIIAAGHEIGIAIMPPAGADRAAVRQEISRASSSLQNKFGLTTPFIKQPFGQSLDVTKQAVADEGYVLISQTYNVVQSRHKDYKTADEVMPEIFGKFVYSVGRGQIVNFRMDFYTNPYLIGDMIEAIKKAKIDNIAYNYYDDKPGVDSGNDSAYAIKNVGAVFYNQNMRYEYPVKIENIPDRLRPDYRSFNVDERNFRENLLKRYLGAPDVDGNDRTLGFNAGELRQLDTKGFVNTEDNVVFLTFDDWGYDAAINKLMYVLRKHNAKGTFFIITRNVQNNPNLLRALAAEGHEIGSHTENHKAMVIRNDKNKLVAVQTPDEYDEDVRTSYQKLAETVGDVKVDGRNSLTRFFRPPTLAISKFGMEKIFGNGYEFVISGSCSTADYSAESISELINRIQNGLYSADGKLNKGAVFVMHMSDSSPYTARALDLLLTANEKRPDGDPLKFKVGLLSDYLIDDYVHTFAK